VTAGRRRGSRPDFAYPQEAISAALERLPQVG
jgi:hypothetical protein